MDATLKEASLSDEVRAELETLGQEAREAARQLALASAEDKDRALRLMAQHIRKDCNDLLQANKRDVDNAVEDKRPDAFIDRLTLTADRVDAMAKGLEDIANLSDPVGEVTAEWERPNGLAIQRVRVPLGVIGIIYESRPNVTADAGGLCLKSGNAVILRGGSDSFNSSRAIVTSLKKGLREANLPENAIQVVPTTDRSAVGEMLRGLDGTIDVIVPRGGKNLVGRVQDEARVPVFAHLEGICHIYVDESADLEMATDIVVNAKMRRTGICGAAETLLVDKAAIASHLNPLVAALKAAGCQIRGDARVQQECPDVDIAGEEDWSTEYLDSIISVKTVDGVGQAIEHIANYGSQHTDCIVSENENTVARFFHEVDSAIVLHNASTQFADGGEFGMGAEIGIATGKMHARGPVGVEQLTSFKYLVRGRGQVRPK